jgi:hypothetical protein
VKRIALSLLTLVSCADPVQNAEREALGPEDPSVPRGELHRPGQPCLVCHDDFSLAGTVYYEDRTTPFDGAQVSFVDAAGNTFQTSTNSAGNFIVRKSDFVPVFPIGAYTDSNGNAVIGVTVTGSDPNNAAQMITHIGRDGACASCHSQAGASSSSPGPVYVSETPP